MTIAVCYVSPEGVVLGADSTSTYGDLGDIHYNHSQKLFEIGEDSTLGVVTWGLGGLQISSHRTLLAHLADDLRAQPPKDVKDVAERWSKSFWQAYSDKNCPMAPHIATCRALAGNAPYDAKNAGQSGMRTEQEEKTFQQLAMSLVVGFCIAGYVLPSRTPEAYEILFDPLKDLPTPQQRMGPWFWGAPNMILRLLTGCDGSLKQAILSSGQWKGTAADLDALIQKHSLTHPILPIRDSIDFTHACISSTIKAFKFSGLSPICGGPIEIAVITTDRRFRWVRHKPWDAAIIEGDL